MKTLLLYLTRKEMQMSNPNKAKLQDAENSRYYIVKTPSIEEQKLLTEKIIPRRKQVEGNVVGLLMPEAMWFTDEFCSRTGLKEYVGCSMGEIRFRPIVTIRAKADYMPLAKIIDKWVERWVDWIMPKIETHLMTYKNTSNIGWSLLNGGFYRPFPSKAAHMTKLLEMWLRDEISPDDYKSAFVVANVRRQTEKRGRDRVYNVLDMQYNVKEWVATDEQRLAATNYGPRIMGRSRGVFLFPECNLITQVFDNALLNVTSQMPYWRHKLGAGKLGVQMKGAVMAYDWERFETQAFMPSRSLARCIGGEYGRFMDVMTSLPFAVPTIDRRHAAFVYYTDDGVPQLGSGISNVTSTARYTAHLEAAEYVTTCLNVHPDDALDFVAQGGGNHDRIILANSGDNAIESDPNTPPGRESGLLNERRDFLNSHSSIEVSAENNFCGYDMDITREHYGTFYLPAASYVRKTALPERGPDSEMRKLPASGHLARRKIFSDKRKPGSTEIDDFFRIEEELLEDLGLPLSRISELAQNEEWNLLNNMRANEESKKKDQALFNVIMSPNFLLEKEYSLTPEEEVMTGFWTAISPELTKSTLKKLLPTTHLKKTKIV
jgi:hypothetical protein